MIFGEFPSDTAEGVMLAHTLKTTGKTLKKGRTLSAQDVAWLRQSGIESVLGARMAAGDVAEDAAAAEIAALLAGPDTNTETRRPYTGRCNLHASASGIVQVDAERLHRLNLLDEAVAVGTLPQHALVRHGQVIATAKIIPFAVPRSLLDACREVAAGGPLLRVAPFRPCRAALVMSDLPGMKERVFEVTVATTRHRIEALGGRLALVLRCAHRQEALEAMMRQALAAGCDLVLVAGATVAKDRRDIAPAAVTAAGGVIEHFGMPVDPGNMLVLARIDKVPLIILPGCGRSRRTNGLDWVLQRLLAGLATTREDIMRMGVGGLIRSPLEADDDDDQDDRSDTGDSAETAPAGPTGDPRVAALVMAAGSSSRMGADHQLLMDIGGVPMVLRAVNAARASRAASVTVVVGHQAEAVEAVLADGGAARAFNPEYAQGMATSLRHGVAALPADAAAVLVLLGDMPRITADHLDRIIEAFDPAWPSIVVPEKDGRRGNPVLWPREFFVAMRGISGDQGARGLIERHIDRVARVEFDDDAIFVDVDRPDDFARAAEPRFATAASDLPRQPREAPRE